MTVRPLHLPSRLAVPALLALLALGCATPAAPSPAVPAAAPVAPKRWAHEEGDLSPDARIRLGALDNGLRFAWMDNPEPRRRTSLRLHVAVGSTAEEQAEQGMAHFLEHMAFNGSENFAPGTLVEWFQQKGVAFGAHVNASTDFTETIYIIDLPESDEDSLREALTVLGDFAGRLLLQHDEVAREVGVIDGEQRERDSAGFRTGVEMLKRQMAGTRVAERIPIGVKEVRAAFTADAVRAFYERWYRPQNMTLVAVGDLQGLDLQPLLEETLGTLPAGEGPPEPVPALGTPTLDDLVFALPNDELPVVQLTAARLRPHEERPITAARLVDEVPLQLARDMLNLRLDELRRKPGTPFVFAAAVQADALDVIEGEALLVAAQPDRWEAALAAGEQELRRALQHGFLPEELQEVQAERLRALDEAVVREPTRESGAWADDLIDLAAGRDVPQGAATRRALLRPAVQGATAESCRAALAAAWERPAELQLVALGRLPAGDLDGERLRGAWEASRAVAVAAPEAGAGATFAYDSGGAQPGEVAEHRTVDDLGLHQVRFANGVRLNVRPTDFAENQVLVSARVGEGRLALAPERQAVAFVASLPGVLSGLGLGAHDSDALRRLTAGRRVGVSLGVDVDDLSLFGGTTPDDLRLQCELLAATLSDPGWRDEALVQAQREIVPLVYRQMEHALAGPIQSAFMPAFHGGDPRFGVPPQEEVEAVTIDDLRAWLEPQLLHGPVEVTVVGAVDPEAVLEAAAATLGRLPPRGEARAFDERRAVALVAGLRQQHEVVTEDSNALVRLCLPATDGRDAALRRRLQLLARVLDDRLRKTVREELGEAYSPSANVSLSRTYPGVGYLTIGSGADPARTDRVLEACLAVVEDVVERGVLADELDRQREPLLKSVRDELRNNGFWLSALAECQERPEALDELRSLEDDYRAVTAGELTDLARRFLDRERASWVVVRPAAAAAAGG